MTVIELAPPGVETPLFRGEFAEEMKGQKAMDVSVLVQKAIAGVETYSQIPELSQSLGVRRCRECCSHLAARSRIG